MTTKVALPFVSITVLEGLLNDDNSFTSICQHHCFRGSLE